MPACGMRRFHSVRGNLRSHVARPEHKWFFLVWIARSAELRRGGYASISATLSLRHCNVIFMTWQCDICDIVMSNYHIAMSYFSLNKWYTSLKRFTCACQNSHGYVKIQIVMSNFDRAMSNFDIAMSNK
jgi:hypothetical protein